MSKKTFKMVSLFNENTGAYLNPYLEFFLGVTVDGIKLQNLKRVTSIMNMEVLRRDQH